MPAEANTVRAESSIVPVLDVSAPLPEAAPAACAGGDDPTGEGSVGAAPLTLDVEALGELGLLEDGMEELFAELVDEFVDVTEGHLRELRGSVADGDGDGVRRLAHTVKGGGGQLGGLALAGACTRLEERCAAGLLDRGADEVHEVEVAYRALQRALHELVVPVTA